MLDKTIDRALLNLWKQIARAGRDLAHVDALLAQRDIDPTRLRIPTPQPADSCKHGEISRVIARALWDGPQRVGEVVAAFQAQRPDLGYLVARKRVYRVGERMMARGLVVRDGGRWRLSL